MVERIQKDRPDDWKEIKLVSPAPADDINWLVVRIHLVRLASPVPDIREHHIVCRMSSSCLCIVLRAIPDTLQEFFVALCGDDGGNQWKTCTYEHPPQTVAVHAYDLEFNTIKSKVERYHTTFGRPIALTELAMRNVSVHLCKRAAVALNPARSLKAMCRECRNKAEVTVRPGCA
jgi:hypothetical protein